MSRVVAVTVDRVLLSWKTTSRNNLLVGFSPELHITTQKRDFIQGSATKRSFQHTEVSARRSVNAWR